MFGYVKPYVPTLTVREYELYRAVYCGLCREMGRVTGQLSRITLSYDFCFLALLLLALSDRQSHTEIVRCPIHAAKKRAVIASHPALSVTSAAAACLVDGKRQDDLTDEKGLHRVKPYLETFLCAAMRSHLRTNRGKTEITTYASSARRYTSEGLSHLSALEQGKCDSIERTAQCFGELLAALFAACTAYITEDTGAASAILTECGLRAGRFVYFCDAMEDLAEDARRGRYNPLQQLWGTYALSGTVPSPMVCESFRIAATIDLEGLGHAVELLPYPESPYVRILKNIVYAGMPQVVRDIAAGKRGNTFSPASDAWERTHAINLPDDMPAQE